MNERRAIARLKQGHIDGLETLVKAYQVRAVRAATLITRDRSTAEDIVQTAFIRVYERIHQFDDTRPFGPWFLRCVVNDAVKAVTRGKIHLALDDPGARMALSETLSDPAEQFERVESEASLWEALAQLPPEQRAAVVLRYYLGLSETEIADRQAAPQGTVKWRLHAARARLRDLLGASTTDQVIHSREEKP